MNMMIWVLLIWPTPLPGQISEPREIAHFVEEGVCKELAKEIQEVTKHLAGCVGRSSRPNPKTST